MKAISDEQIRNTPKVISLAKDDGFYYFFTEKLEGTTLDEVVKTNALPTIDIKELINNIFIAVFHINQVGFWYSDLCQKNIFIGRSKKYYLIDIDSSVSPKRYNYQGRVSFEYPSVLLQFSQTFGNRPDFKLTSLSGTCVNQAELIALTMDIKHSFKFPIERKHQVINMLLHNNYGGEYIGLFTQLMNNQSNWPETRKLINKIIGRNQIV